MTAEQEGLMDKDLYGLLSKDLPPSLQVDAESTWRRIRKAYHQQALIWHPDKNKEDPKAGAHFDLLRRVYELLGNEHLRHVYNARDRARRARQLELEKQDAVRRRMRENLEQRERTVQSARDFRRQKTQHQEAEEENLRVIRQMQEAGLFVQRPAPPPPPSRGGGGGASPAGDSPEGLIRISWKRSKYRGGGSDKDPLLSRRADRKPFTRTPEEADLRKLFSEFGPIETLVTNPEKRKAVLVFQDRRAAEEAVRKLRFRIPSTGSSYYKFRVSLSRTAASSSSSSAAASASSSSSSSSPRTQEQATADPFDFFLPPSGVDMMAGDRAFGLGDPVFSQHTRVRGSDADPMFPSPFAALREGMDFDLYEATTEARLQEFPGHV